MTGTAGHRGRLTAAPRTQTRVFPARADQVRQARKFLARQLEGCPVADDAVLCVSELASNSILYSESRKPGGTFTVCAEIQHGVYVRVEVHDGGGTWHERPQADGRAHGLDIVRDLAADSGIDGDGLTGRIVWARLDWPAAGAQLTGGTGSS